MSHSQTDFPPLHFSITCWISPTFARSLTYSLQFTAALIGLAMTIACQAKELPVAKTQAIENPAAAGSQFPRLASLSDGGVLMSWVESHAEAHILKFGVLREGRWVRQGEIARGRDWFINWSDFPSVTAIRKSFWVAHWLVKKKMAALTIMT